MLIRMPLPQGRPTGGGTAPRAGAVLVFLSWKVLALPDLSALPQGRPTGGGAWWHAALLIRLMLSAVLRSSQTASVWLLAWRWLPACPFAAAINPPSLASSNLPSGTPRRLATGAGFPREWPTNGTVSFPSLCR